MDYPNNNTELRKNKHLNFNERMTIELRLKDGLSPYKIAKELDCPINTILNEIRRGTTTQIKQNKLIVVYLADTGNATYNKNRQKSGNDCVLLNIVERQTRNAIVRQIASKTADAVMKELACIRIIYGNQFSQVFKTVTGDNGSEFADLSTLENGTDTNVYFTHPYSSFEKGTNERHNGLIRRFIPKGKRMSNYNPDDIAFIADWMNTLPRRILNYKTPEELFELQLDIIYAA